MTNSPKSTEQREAYDECMKKQTELFHQQLRAEKLYASELDTINTELTNLWNDYHKEWMR